MSKYTLPSPEQYMQGLFRQYLVASLTGQQLKAECYHAEMEIFAHAMGRLTDYHKKRNRKK